MPEKIDDLLPTAREIQKQTALHEAEKAEQYARRLAAAEAEKRALIERLSKPSGLTEDEKVKLASTVIQRAVRNGLTEVQVYRFPNYAVHRQRPRHQSAGAGLGEDAYGNSAGNLQALVRLSEAARLPDPLSGRRFSGRRAGRYRHCHRLGRLI